MGINHSINKLNFESVQNIINNNDFIIINTLNINNQDCLIKNTINANQEVEIINSLLKNSKKKKILIYGENCCDITVINKYNQLFKLGFTNLFIYIGGLFEWLLLQDIYGEEQFPTTSKIIDILKYKGKNILYI